MDQQKKFTRTTLWHSVGLAILTILVYWPASFRVFSFKHDALVQYLSFRYHLSESVQHGFFPFWTPYLYTGFPIHADIQGMTWNPFVLIISLFTRYDMSVLQTEVMLYFIAAAIGMYKLLLTLGCNRWICLTGAVAYMGCGYMTDSASVIPWVGSAAFLPFVFNYLIIAFRKPEVFTLIKWSLSLCLLFLCGYPSFFIFAGWIILAALIAKGISSWRAKNLQTFFKLTLGLFGAVVLFLIICSPAIISYADFLPYYQRGSGLGLERANTNPFPLFSSISFLLPQAVSRPHEFIDTDASARNAYIGLFILLFFFLSLFRPLKGIGLFILLAVIFSFLFSLGNATPIREWSYRFLPGMDTFRHPATMRVFTSIGMIMLAGIFINDILNDQDWQKRIRKLAWIVLGIMAALSLWFGLTMQSPNWNAPDIKAVLDSISFEWMAFVQGLIQCCFLLLFLLITRKKEMFRPLVFLLLILNSIVFTQMALPFSFFSSLRTTTVDQYLDSFPDGYPLPEVNQTIHAAEYSTQTGVDERGYRHFYSKELRIHDHITTPTVNSSYENFLNNPEIRKAFDNYPWIFIAGNAISDQFVPATGKMFTISKNKSDSVIIKDFSPNRFRLLAESADSSSLVIFQQYNHNWRAFVNGNEVPINIANLAFMSIDIPAGRSEIEFRYQPFTVILSIYFSLAALLLLLTGGIVSIFKNRSTHA